MEPKERVFKALEDVQDCASFVVADSEGKDLSYYRRDRLFRQAGERNLQIIGEATDAPPGTMPKRPLA
jgi:uncharacterized protein with HEPN domain